MYPKYYNDLFRSFDRTEEVFVGMPFSKEFEPRWKDIIKQTIRSFGLKPYRVKERVVSDSIPVDILDGIARARYLIFDISNEKTQRPNPNVMYELGIAHATRLPEEVIIIRDHESEKVPFDIKHIRWNKFFPGSRERSISIIKRLIRNAEKQVDVTRDLILKRVTAVLDPDMISFLQTIRPWKDTGFDLYPFDLNRKGIYSLPDKDCSESYLRLLARNLIRAGIVESAPPVPPQNKIYGGTPEYHLTHLGKALLLQIPQFGKNSKVQKK